MKLDNYGRRVGLTPTRGGWIERVFFVCYDCGAEIDESELEQHEHESGAQ